MSASSPPLYRPPLGSPGLCDDDVAAAEGRVDPTPPPTPAPPPPPPAAPLVNWDTAQAILYIVQERVSWAVGRAVEFDEAHVAQLQRLFAGDNMAFWTVADQLHERMLCADWARIPDDSRFIHALIAKLQPIPCDIPEPDFVQMLLAKLWPQQQQQPLAQEMPPTLQTRPLFFPATVPAAAAATYSAAYAAAAADMEFQQQQAALAHEQMVTLAFANVYTWQAALNVVEMIGARVSQLVGRRVSFDDKHRMHLRARYDADPLGFWSVLDQMQDRMMQADWSGVRNDARFIQSFINKFVPVDMQLSEFMSAVIPQHSLVPYGYPPHILRTRSFGPAAAPSAPPPPHYPQQQQQRQQQQQVGQQPMGDPPVVQQQQQPIQQQQQQQQQQQPTAVQQQQQQQQHEEDIDLHYPHSWRAALTALDAIESRIAASCGRAVHFDEKHKHHLHGRWETDPRGFFSVLDQIQERLMQSNWDSIRDVARYIQSLVNRFEPQSVLSKFMQSFITPPDIAAAAAAAEAATANITDVGWDDVMSVIFPAIEQRSTQAVGRLVLFDEKHKLHLKQRYDRDASAFWSILDQVQDRMAHSDWSNVRDDGRFIQSFITKAEPVLPLELSEFLRSLLVLIHQSRAAAGVSSLPPQSHQRRASEEDRLAQAFGTTLSLSATASGNSSNSASTTTSRHAPSFDGRRPSF